jgi:hypothetical protein
MIHYSSEVMKTAFLLDLGSSSPKVFLIVSTRQDFYDQGSTAGGYRILPCALLTEKLIYTQNGPLL